MTWRWIHIITLFLTFSAPLWSDSKTDLGEIFEWHRRLRAPSTDENLPRLMENFFAGSLNTLGFFSPASDGLARLSVLIGEIPGIKEPHSWWEHSRTFLGNLRDASLGLSVGYGTALMFLSEDKEKKLPLPQVPPRPHPAWPHIHCVAHCTASAAIGGKAGRRWSILAGLNDEIFQAWVCSTFNKAIYPLIWKDIEKREVAKEPASDAEKVSKMERTLRVLMKYLFGTVKEKKAARAMAIIDGGREARDELSNAESLLYLVVDACESAWQQSDFEDNEIGRQGGMKAQRKPASEQFQFCTNWCTDHGISRVVEEGPGTKRKWGPFHPLHPGPVPNLATALYGKIKVDLDFPELKGPHPEFILPEKLDPPLEKDEDDEAGEGA